MKIQWRPAIASILFCGLAVSAAPHGVTPESTAATAERAWSELTSSMESMHRAMSSVGPSGDTDVDFVRLMLPHHQAAIDMARSELLLGNSPELKRLAQEIITDQQSEIDLMQLWLKKHGPDHPKTGGSPNSRGKGGLR